MKEINFPNCCGEDKLIAAYKNGVSQGREEILRELLLDAMEEKFKVEQELLRLSGEGKQ
jgi:hypothetical protein